MGKARHRQINFSGQLPFPWGKFLLTLLALMATIGSAVLTEYRDTFVQIARVVLEILNNAP